MLLPVNWYPFSDLIEVDRTIISVFGGGDVSVLRQVGAYSARLNLTGIYRDHVVKENGEWKIRSRDATMDAPYDPGDVNPAEVIPIRS